MCYCYRQRTDQFVTIQLPDAAHGEHGVPDQEEVGAEDRAAHDQAEVVSGAIAPATEQLRDQRPDRDFQPDIIDDPQEAGLLEEHNAAPRAEEHLENGERSDTVNPFVDTTDSGDEDLDYMICDVEPFLQHFNSNNSVDIKGIYARLLQCLDSHVKNDISSGKMFFFYDDGDLNTDTNEVTIKITDMEHWLEVLLASTYFRYFKEGHIKKGKKYMLNTSCMKTGKLCIVSILSLLLIFIILTKLSHSDKYGAAVPGEGS